MLEAVWAVEAEERMRDQLQDCIGRAMDMRLIKYLSSSGMSKSTSRRRSSAANTAGKFLFNHLRIYER